MNTATIDHQKYLTIPLQPESREWAKKFASSQYSADKSKRVYLNTLAVYAVHTYLCWIQVETDLQNSDTWNLGANTLFNICDLDLPKIGKLVCCPVLPDADSFNPPELLPPDSIAYVPVRFKSILNEVELLGYRPIIEPNNPPERIDLDFLEDSNDDGSSLFPIENLLDWLFYVQDVREKLEDEELPLIAGIRTILESQQRSLAQFAVQSIYTAKKIPQTLYRRFGKELLVSNSSPEAINKLGRQLSSSLGNSSESSITNEEANRELEEIGAQFLQLVQQIIAQ